MSRGKILFKLSGSIACYKACDAISKLVQAGFEVETVATASALEFVGRATLEGLTGREVHTDLFQAGRAMEHIQLAKWAEVVILCPASAHSIAKLANGLADDLVSTLFLAHDFKKPYLVSPAMNANMWDHPATRANIEKIRSFGAQVLETGEGRLACGDVGKGRLLEPSEIVRALEAAMTPSTTRATRILITSGGTRESIDGVRAITNTSSGRTGATLAEDLIAQGHDVVYLHAESAVRPSTVSPRLRLRSFTDFNSLEGALKDELSSSHYDVVLHAAAVSDFSVASVATPNATIAAPLNGKIDSTESLAIHLKQNPKLVDSIKSLSVNPSIRVVAFKLTNSGDDGLRERAVLALASRAKPDLIVHNDINEISASTHRFTLWQEGRPRAEVDGAHSLAEKVNDWIEGGLT